MDIDKFLDEHENKDLLRFLTCGSVDDGKSTLIGRLLYDSKLIFDDQLSTLRKDSEKSGTTGAGEIDYALLLDGLKAEREQGITIDVAYRYFATPKRKFIIADTPGHEQYTRNMATGASTANLAVILIDARYGVVTQTKRHAFIVSLLGIKHVIVAINKMDLNNYSEDVFNTIKADFAQFIEPLGVPDIRYIPLSALKGDNVVDKSTATGWYDGETLLATLEKVNITTDHNFNDFRFPVQYVNRPHLNFRGFAGTIASGVIKPGDEIAALPSGKRSTVKNIVTADGNLDEAFAGQAITLELQDEIDISSGEMIVKVDNTPAVSKSFDAMLIWMSEQPLDPSRTYHIKHTAKMTKAKVDVIKYKVDVNTLRKQNSDTLELNEIGRVVISSYHELFFDAYRDNHHTGSFILIDTISNNTVAAGMINAPVAAQDVPVDSEREVLEKYINDREFNWDHGIVSPKQRATRNHHYGKTVIITGSKDSGKQQLAAKLEHRLFQSNLNSYYLGIGSIRDGLDADIQEGFVNRDEHLRRLGELSRIMTDAGLIFITSIDDLDDYELEHLKLLNTPNEFFVISVDSHRFDSFKPDIAIEGLLDFEAALSQIVALLGAKKIIPEYCI